MSRSCKAENFWSATVVRPNLRQLHLRCSVSRSACCFLGVLVPLQSRRVLGRFDENIVKDLFQKVQAPFGLPRFHIQNISVFRKRVGASVSNLPDHMDVILDGGGRWLLFSASLIWLYRSPPETFNFSFNVFCKHLRAQCRACSWTVLENQSGLLEIRRKLRRNLGR